MKKNVNPQYCEVHTNGFVLDIQLFPSSTGCSVDILGSTIQLGKPAALKIVRDLKDEVGKPGEPYKETIVQVLDKEYENTRIKFMKSGSKYKITDIEQTVVLGFIHERTFEAFAGDNL